MCGSGFPSQGPRGVVACMKCTFLCSPHANHPKIYNSPPASELTRIKANSTTGRCGPPLCWGDTYTAPATAGWVWDLCGFCPAAQCANAPHMYWHRWPPTQKAKGACCPRVMCRTHLQQPSPGRLALRVRALQTSHDVQRFVVVCCFYAELTQAMWLHGGPWGRMRGPWGLSS